MIASSYTTRTVVLSVAGRPSCGSFWMKPSQRGALLQSLSSRRPSTLMPPFAARIARAVLSSAGGAFVSCAAPAAVESRPFPEQRPFSIVTGSAAKAIAAHANSLCSFMDMPSLVPVLRIFPGNETMNY